MKQTEAQKRATKKYHDSLDRINLRIPKGDKELISEHAASKGESITSFIRRAISETMERDNRNKKL